MTGRLADLRRLLYSDVARARAELMQHVKEIRMLPQKAEGERYYAAVGKWNLLGGNVEKDRARHLLGVRARLLAGARSLPIAPTQGFEIPLVAEAA